MADPTYEYRVVDKDGHEPNQIHPHCKYLYCAEAGASMFDSRSPKCENAPHRVERREVGEWKPVEGDK